jgi:hypothetical protein
METFSFKFFTALRRLYLFLSKQHKMDKKKRYCIYTQYHLNLHKRSMKQDNCQTLQASA